MINFFDRLQYYSFYIFIVTTLSACGGDSQTTTVTTIPVTPSALTIQSSSQSPVDLSWTDSASDETGFKVERKQGVSGSYTLLAILPANSISYSDISVTVGITYIYRLRAYNSAGNSPYTNEATVSISGVTPLLPAAPTSLIATAISASQVDLIWTDNATDETGFRLERKIGTAGVYSEITTFSANVTSFSDTSLTAGQDYIYRIRAYNSAGDSSYSNEAVVNIADVIPAAPTLLSTNTISSVQIDLTWTDSSDNELGFYIDRKKGAAGIFTRIATLNTDVTSYSDNFLNEQTIYYYRIQSYNLSGRSNYANESNTTTEPEAAAGLWARTYTGVGDSRAYSVVNTSDGGFIFAGSMNMNPGGLTNDDVWIVKLKADETIEWQKTYGGPAKDIAKMVQQTFDGGFIVAGESASYHSGSSSSDVWVLRLDNMGNIVWQKRYGDAPAERAESIVQTDDDADGVRDDGFIITGFTAAVQGSLILKLDSSGEVEWHLVHEAGSSWVYAYAIQQTSDGGFIATGYTSSSHDLWVIKIAAGGTVSWQRSYPGADNSEGRQIIQTDDDGDGINDDGYLVVGKTDTNSLSEIQNALWAIKLDSAGAITWQKSFLGSGSEAGYDVIQTSSNGFLIAGTTTGFGASSNDYWLINLLANGNIDWEKRYGGLGGETPYSVQQSTDNGFLVVGTTNSFVTGITSVWGLKLDASTNINFKVATNGRSQATTAAVANTTSTPVIIIRNPVSSMTYSATPTSATAVDSVATVKTQSE